MASSRTVCYNTQRTWIYAGTETDYISDAQPVVAEGTAAIDPTIGTVVSGMVLDIQTVAARDDSFVTATIRSSIMLDTKLHDIYSQLFAGFVPMSPRKDYPDMEVKNKDDEKKQEGTKPFFISKRVAS
ncbi:MAG: hypothetical protein HC880_19575 [Bacteroidia bacterium]|nr:hypothetical protein [Bacteroidia bacterium]